MTSIERTAYPRFKRLITAHELHLFFAPSRDEVEWAAGRSDSDEHLLAQLLALKSYQRMGCFPKLDEILDAVVDFVRRAVDLPKGTVPRAANRTAERQRTAVRQRTGLSYDKAKARKIAEAVMRSEAVSKNRPADLINIALEKVVEAGLELPGFTTLDALAAKIRTEVNASICMGIYDRLSEVHHERLLALLSDKDESGTTKYNKLKQSAKAPTWSHFRAQAEHLGWVDELGETGVWLEGVATGKITDFAGEADTADAPALRDYNLVKRLALMVCLVHKARMRARGDLTTMFCKRIALQVKRARAELEEIREQQQALVEALIGNYRTVLQHIDADSPVQAAREKAAAMTAEILTAVGELDQDAGPDAVAARLGDQLALTLHILAKALRVQAGALGVPAAAVDDFGGFEGQYERIEKVAAHHGNYWEVLLYGHLLKDRSTMYDLTSRLELRATSEDSRVLDALAHARRHKNLRDYIPERHEDGRPVDISFATLNWQKAVRDKNRPGVFMRKHFEAMVFAALAEELRTGDVAVAGSEEYADWSEQLLPWEDVEAKLGDYLLEVGLAEAGDETPYDAVTFRRQLEDKLTAAAASADAGYPDNEGLVIDPEADIPSLKAHRSEGQRASARELEQEIKARMPERSLLGIISRTAYWVEWWRRFGPASENEPKLKDPFGRYVITTFVKDTNMGPYEAARHIPGVSGHELSLAANRHFSIPTLNEAIADLVNAHACLDISQAWGDGSAVATDAPTWTPTSTTCCPRPRSGCSEASPGVWTQGLMPRLRV